MKIAVLMTCFNRVESTLRCLDGLFAQELPADCALEVWLVDDASPDGTADRVAAKYPQVQVVRSPGNLFWCKGMRLAWDRAAAAGDWDAYLWLNDDVVLYPGAVKAAIADCRQLDERGVIVGTFATGPNASEVYYGCGRDRANSAPAIPNGEVQRAYGLMSGNFVLVPRAAYAVAGKIYDGFRHGVADTDYGLTLEERGVGKYISSVMTGWCRPNRAATNAELGKMTLGARLRLLASPKGRNLHDAFLLKLRHRGWLAAVASAIHIVGMVVFARSPSGR